MEEEHIIKKRKKGLTELRRAVCLKLKCYSTFTRLLSWSIEYVNMNFYGNIYDLTGDERSPEAQGKRMKYIEQLSNISDENFSDEILSTIFTPSKAKSVQAKMVITEHFCQMKFKELKVLLDQHWVDIRTFPDSKKPKFKNDIIDFLACKVLGMESVLSKQNKRKNEQLNIDSDEFQNEYGGNCIFEMLGIQIPKDVMLEIFAYIFFNIDYFKACKHVNPYSLVCVSWYLLTLECYGRFVKEFLIRPKKVYSVPLIVLQNLRDVAFDVEKMYSKDIKYLMNNFTNIRKMTLSKNFQSFFNVLKTKPKTILKHLEVINIREFIDKMRSKKFKVGEIKFPPAECVPKLNKLIVKYFEGAFKVKINDTVKQIREIEVSEGRVLYRRMRSYSSETLGFDFNIFSYFENLRAIRIKLNYSRLRSTSNVFETLSKLKNLVSMDFDGSSEGWLYLIEMFNSFPPNMVNLVELKVDLRDYYHTSDANSILEFEKVVKSISSKLVKLKKFHFIVSTSPDDSRYCNWIDHKTILKVLNAFGHLAELVFELRITFSYSLLQMLNPDNTRERLILKFDDFRKFWKDLNLSFYKKLERFEFRCKVGFKNVRHGIDIGSQIIKTEDFLLNGPGEKIYDRLFTESNIFLNENQKICFHFGECANNSLMLSSIFPIRKVYNENGDLINYQWTSSKIVLSMSENDILIVDSIKHFKDYDSDC